MEEHDGAGSPGEALTSHCFVKNLKKYAREAGVEDFHLHRTRHTFARIVSEVSGDITATQNALDHQHRSTTRVYVQRIAVKEHVLVVESMQCDPESFKNLPSPRRILPYAKIHRGIEEGELKGIVEDIRRLVERVRTSGKFGEMYVPDTIEVGIASYDDHAPASEWAASRGMEEHDLVECPNILTDEIARAKREAPRQTQAATRRPAGHSRSHAGERERHPLRHRPRAAGRGVGGGGGLVPEAAPRRHVPHLRRREG